MERVEKRREEKRNEGKGREEERGEEKTRAEEEIRIGEKKKSREEECMEGIAGGRMGFEDDAERCGGGRGM